MIYHFPPTKLKHQSLIDTFQEIFTIYETPEETSADGGPQFIAHQFQEFLHQWVCNIDFHQGNTLNQTTGLNLVSNLPNIYMIMLLQMAH